LARRSRKTQVQTNAKPGSESWVAAKVQNTERWLQAKQLIEGRQGELKNRWTRTEIIESGRLAADHLKKNWPISTSEAGPTDRVGFPGIITPFFIYTGGSWGGPLLRAAVTYENTTKDFAAAVVAADPQGLRIWYCSLAPNERAIGIVPWELEPGGTYWLALGIDADEDGKIDKRVEQREFVFPQQGSPINIKVKPRVNYVVEIDQIKRSRPAGPAPDPGLSAEDIRFNSDRNLLMARIHNVGSKAVRNVKVAFYYGDPQDGGRRIGVQTIPNIEAPSDLEPRTVTVGINYRIESPTEIYVVVDPDNEIANEITTFNNVAHKKLPEASKETVKDRPKPTVTSFRRGR